MLRSCQVPPGREGERARKTSAESRSATQRTASVAVNGVPACAGVRLGSRSVVKDSCPSHRRRRGHRHAQAGVVESALPLHKAASVPSGRGVGILDNCLMPGVRGRSRRKATSNANQHRPSHDQDEDQREAAADCALNLTHTVADAAHRSRRGVSQRYYCTTAKQASKEHKKRRENNRRAKYAYEGGRKNMRRHHQVWRKPSRSSDTAHWKDGATSIHLAAFLHTQLTEGGRSIAHTSSTLTRGAPRRPTPPPPAQGGPPPLL